ncbi:hypothetical protein F1559_004794 [Cyanidiococcus yangmingshanensis]|uniref:Cytochrome P450 n=1 Tax=Cyanidiococcus yangmingshanensis TaxID=2690220 RepID=A0A7J7IPG2_9RHOD|nr:hypothetical protein F1559_004794 [Cyanidiococcus yangmingshanensis]
MFGRRLTFVFSERGLDQFFHSAPSKVSFIRAVEPFTHGIFGLPPSRFAAILHELLGQLRSELQFVDKPSAGLASHLRSFATALRATLCERLQAHAIDGALRLDDLFDFCGRSLFAASLRTLFGCACANTLNPHDRLYETFVQFDQSFELASLPLPQWLLPWFTGARRRLLQDMQRALPLIEPEAPAGKLLQRLESDTKLQASVMLTLLWASSANTLLSAGWLISLSACEEGFTRPPPDTLAWNLVLETLRLTSSGIAVRSVLEPLFIDGLCIPTGDYLCVSPWLAHRDDIRGGERFHPQRFTGLADKKALFRGRGRMLHTFGGGLYRCPGQEFALHELVYFIQIFYEFIAQVKLDQCDDPLSLMDPYRLVGIKRPTRALSATLVLVPSSSD